MIVNMIWQVSQKVFLQKDLFRTAGSIKLYTLTCLLCRYSWLKANFDLNFLLLMIYLLLQDESMLFWRWSYMILMVIRISFLLVCILTQKSFKRIYFFKEIRGRFTTWTIIWSGITCKKILLYKSIEFGIPLK